MDEKKQFDIEIMNFQILFSINRESIINELFSGGIDSISDTNEKKD